MIPRPPSSTLSSSSAASDVYKRQVLTRGDLGALEDLYKRGRIFRDQREKLQRAITRPGVTELSMTVTDDGLAFKTTGGQAYVRIREYCDVHRETLALEAKGTKTAVVVLVQDEVKCFWFGDYAEARAWLAGNKVDVYEVVDVFSPLLDSPPTVVASEDPYSKHSAWINHLKACQGRDRSRVFKSSRSPGQIKHIWCCLLYTSPSPRDRTRSRMPSSA
eukprot:TRINITY_DN47709_c0_g1_i1.p1 TRINITY_DN47709_c0_g1~~TRINITY_DN47709_c0_g1_i1.p1  ORF type:complete len:218 (+),score=28.75 TRINITY_DN47709_c0_g1_i1:74-727(+)